MQGGMVGFANPEASVPVEDIRTILTEQLGLPIDFDAIGENDDLYACGLTSHGSVNLMLALEDRFGVEFPDRMLRRKTFESIAAIRSAVAELLADKPDA